MAKYEVDVHYRNRAGEPRYETGTLDENGYFRRTTANPSYTDSELDSCKLRTATPVQRGQGVEVYVYDSESTDAVKSVLDRNGVDAKVDAYGGW